MDINSKWLSSEFKEGTVEKIDDKIYRKALALYPYGHDSSGSYLANITKVEAFKTSESEVIVQITTHRPGIFIGVRGKQIKGIEAFMSSLSGMTVKILVLEERMFSSEF